MNRKVRTALILLGLFLAAWAPRVLGLDDFVTIDERKWLARSANFYQAVSHGDLANTFQREHPGVTVMWAGTLGFLSEYPAYADEAPGQFAWDREYLEAWLEETAGRNPLDLLEAGRWWVVLAISLTITASYFPLRLLFGEIVGVFGTLYLAWTPFYVALSRQLHPDGLVSSLTFLALLLFLAWLYCDNRRRYLILSGIVMGLAWLTKTPAIFLVPTGGLLLAWEWVRDRRTPRLPGEPERRPALRRFGDFVFWGVVATATFVLLWPAMWLNPIGTLGAMIGEMGVYVERHTNLNFFMGRPVEDPGLFFYPVALLFRTTPLTWLGLAAAGIFVWRRQLPFEIPRVRRAAGALLLFAVVFTAGMTIGAKKFDRYILPAFLALDVVAVLGYWGIAFWLRRHWPEKPWTQGALLPAWILGGAAFLHGLLGFVHYPYYFTYYNPLVGGSWTAPRVLFAGWGEGLDQAAAYLNEQPDAENLNVAAWYHDGPFSYFFDGRAVSLSSDSPLFWIGTDYAVLYVNQWQRQSPSPEAIDYFFARQPAHIVRDGGMELARIYEMRGTELPDFVDIARESSADFGNLIRLVGHQLNRLEFQPGEQIHANLFLQKLTPMDVNYNVQMRVVGENGQEIGKVDRWPYGAPTSDWPVREMRADGYAIKIPPETPPGLYQVNVEFYDPATLQRLPVTDSATGELIAEQTRHVALIRVGAAPAPTQPFGEAFNFADTINLIGADAPSIVGAGETLPLRLYWESLTPTPTDYTVFVHVIGPDGEQVAGQDSPPRKGFAATHLWRPGQRIADELTIPLPAELPAGIYEIRTGLYTLDGGRLPLVREGEIVGDYAVVDTFEVP
jgi:hypothetical protein